MSAKPAEDTARNSNATDFYVWKVPGTPVHIRISLNVIRRIREYLTDAAGHNSEAGGLLVGNPHAGRPEIVDFAPISRDDASGHHFVLSTAEKADLRRYADEVNRRYSQESVIGYFRSDIRGGVCLYEEDQKLIQDCFPDPSNVFLVVRINDIGASTAGFFFSDEGNVFSSFSFMEFEFDEAILALQLEALRAELRSSLDASDGALPDVSKLPGELSAISESGVVKSRAVRWVVPATAGIALMAAGAYLYTYRTNEPKSTTSTPETSRTRTNTSGSLGLSVAASGSEINISWDAKSPLITAARVALLTIDDGGHRRDLPLTKVQLLSSRLVYTRSNDTVHIALETYGEDGSVARENIISMGNNAGKAATTQYETTVNTLVSAPPALQEKKRAPVREFVAPGQRIAAPQMENPAPPIAASADFNARLDLRQMPPTPQVPAAAPAAVPPPPPQANSTSQSPTRQSQPIQVVSRAQQRPPVPLRQVRPVLPDNVKSMLTSRASVKVRIQVDASGKVTEAEPLMTGGSLDKFLSSAAASAAKMWIFQPATEGDRRVPSELTVEFTFVPERLKR